jgi:hypothetical protein
VRSLCRKRALNDEEGPETRLRCVARGRSFSNGSKLSNQQFDASQTIAG